MVLASCGTTPLEAVTVDPRSLAMGLVAHWTFDERSGTVVGDHSGNGHDGQLTGGSWIMRVNLREARSSSPRETT